jgi:hypothetical protein
MWHCFGSALVEMTSKGHACNGGPVLDLHFHVSSSSCILHRDTRKTPTRVHLNLKTEHLLSATDAESQVAFGANRDQRRSYQECVT